MLEGRLGDFTLPDILRLLAFTAKSGRLWVSDDGVEGRVDVLEGRVRDASPDATRLGLARRLLGQDLVDADTLTGVLAEVGELPTDLELARRLAEDEALDVSLLGDLAREQVVDALFELLRWPEGRFRFEAGTAEHRGPSVLDLALPVDDLLDEVGRRLEAHTAIDERTGSADAVVTISRPGRERAEVGLSPEGWTLLALVDGNRTVGDLVRLSGQGDYRTRRTLASLLDEEIVTVGDPSSLPPAERLLRAHETLATHEARLAGPGVEHGATTPDEEPGLVTPDEPEPVATPEPATAHESEPAAAPEPERASPPEPERASTPEPERAAAPEPERASTPEPERAAAPEPERASPPEPERASAPEPEPATAPDVSGPAASPGGVTSLRARARTPRVRTDPEMDEALIQQLIDGVESL